MDRPVAKDLHGIPQEDVRRILARIETRENPRPPGSKKLSGQERYHASPGRWKRGVSDSN